METLVNMTVLPEHLLIGDMIMANGKPARVLYIIELWTDEFRLILTCPDGNYNYIYSCPACQPVTLLSI